MNRNTTQREAIQNAFLIQDRPLRVSEVLDYGRESSETLNLATVYRNVKRLVKEGWLLKIEHPFLGTLYERAGSGHHHYFYCRVCDRLLMLPGCALNVDEHAPPGFKTESHDIFLSGVCVECVRETAIRDLAGDPV